MNFFRHFASTLTQLVAAWFTVLCIPFLFIVLLNWQDEPLNPDVIKRMAWVVDDKKLQNNAMVAIWGLNAPDGVDPYDYGLRVVRRIEGLFAKRASKKEWEELNAQLKPAQTQTKGKWGCDYQKERNCLNYYLLKRDQVTKAIESLGAKSARFELIKAATLVEEVLPINVESPMPEWLDVMELAEIARAKASIEFASGNPQLALQILLDNQQFFRRIIDSPSTVIATVIAFTNIRHDLRIIAEFIAEDSKIASRFPAELDALTTSIPNFDRHFKDLLMYEGDAFLRLLTDDLTAKFFPEHSSIAAERIDRDFIGKNEAIHDLVSRLFVRFIFKPNQTLNLFHESDLLDAKLASLDASKLDEARSAHREVIKERLGAGLLGIIYPYNFVGKALHSVRSEPQRLVLEGFHDTEGQFRLVRLQIEIAAKQISVDRVPHYLSSVSDSLKNPYTVEPFQWKAETQEIVFEARQKANSRFQGGTKVVVSLLPLAKQVRDDVGF